jgi:uncharacterized RDD family membrane protein YckC
MTILMPATIGCTRDLEIAGRSAISFADEECPLSVSTDSTACPMCGALVNRVDSNCGKCGESMTGGTLLEIGASGSAIVETLSPAVSTVGTVAPRYIAAMLDNVLAMVLAVMAAKLIQGDAPLIQVPLLVGVYLGYYLVFEWLLSRTPGKMLMGLVVIQRDGRRCTRRQALVRTAFRLLEVNPLLLGGAPAALSIIWTRNHQRLGDKLAGTIVAFSERLRRK